MEVKYLCKKRILNKGFGGYIEVGDVVGVVFSEIRTIKIVKVGTETQIQPTKISRNELKEHFILYDDIEHLDAVTAMKVLVNKFEDCSNEHDVLMDMKYYVKLRYKYLQQ